MRRASWTGDRLAHLYQNEVIHDPLDKRRIPREAVAPPADVVADDALLRRVATTY